MKAKLLIIANNNIGTGQSGGDTIFLEFIKNWQSKIKITVFGSSETEYLLKRYQLSPSFIKTDRHLSTISPTPLNLFCHQLRRIFLGKICFLKNINTFRKSDYCYTVSDFLPDFIFGLFYKIVNPRGTWLCGQYLFSPHPGSKNSPYRQEALKGYLYYLAQLITQFFARRFANQILITSEPDRSRFPNKKIIVVQGGVDIRPSEKYLRSSNIIPINKRHFDAVFQGRLHPQKGVLELVDIWKLVINKMPTAKLAIIGDGQLQKKLKEKILKLKLNKNIVLFGFKSGSEKYDIFKNSKIVVHPAIYDSGGMAAAEAMAWGLPGVSFDLESLKSYYPQGMLKTPCFNYDLFAQNIINLLTKKSLYQKTSIDALNLIRKTWDWRKRSQNIYNQIFND